MRGGGRGTVDEVGELSKQSGCRGCEDGILSAVGVFGSFGV